MLVVSVAGSIASEKVALGETSSATPVAPTTGAVALIVGGVVSLPAPPHSMRASAQSAWSESCRRPVGDDEPQLAGTGDRDVDELRRRRPGHRAAVVDLGGACVHLEDDRARRSDLVVDSDAGLEAAAVRGQARSARRRLRALPDLSVGRCRSRSASLRLRR